MGKTELAKSLLCPLGFDSKETQDENAERMMMPLVVDQLDELKKWDPMLHSGIIYDEVSLLHLPREAQIIHCTLNRQVAVWARFHNAILDRSRLVIFTTNLRPEQVVLFDDPAIRRRVQVVVVRERGVYEPWDLDSDGPHCTALRCPNTPYHHLFYRHQNLIKVT